MDPQKAARRTDLKAEQEKRKCKNNCSRFIQRWVQIEDKDKAGASGGIAVPFVLWKEQKKALAAILAFRLLIILKARQLGVTWLALAYAVWRMLFFPGYTVVALSKNEDDAKELVTRVRFILEHLPPWLTRHGPTAKGSGFSGPVWDATTQIATIWHPGDQAPSIFKSMPAAQGSGRSLTANLVLLDEWAFQAWAKEIFDSAYPTINRPTGGQLIGLSTNKRGTLFEGIVKKAAKSLNNFRLVFLPWWSDPRRDKEWYERTKADLPRSYLQEYPATVEEALSAGEGTAFPEFTESIHVCRPFAIPAWWKRWRSNDPGFADPFCWHWFAVSPDGIIYIYREYTRSDKDPRVTYSDQAREVERLSVVQAEGETAPEQIGNTVVGRDAWNKLGRALDMAGKSIIDCYREGGLVGCTPPPSSQQQARATRKALMHEYLKPIEDELTGRTIARLQIFSTCTSLIEALPELVNDPKDAEKVATEPHIYTNPFDCAGYGLVAWAAERSTPPKEELTGEAAKIHRHIESMIKQKNKQEWKRYQGGMG